MVSESIDARTSIAQVFLELASRANSKSRRNPVLNANALQTLPRPLGFAGAAGAVGKPVGLP